MSDGEEGLVHDAGSKNMPWQAAAVSAVSALASEYGNAVRQTFTQDSSISASGRVEQGHRVHASAYEHKRFGQFEAGHISGQRQGTDKRDAEAVQADIQRVSRKIVAADASTQVILRFNFMSGAEARVWVATCKFTCNIHQ